MSTRNVSLQLLAEVHKRRQKRRNIIMLKIGGILLLIGIGLVLVYWIQYYGWTSIRSLLLMGGVGAIATLFLWCRITQRPMPFSQQFHRLTQGRPRYTIGLIAMALLIIHQANPNLINVPVGELYTRILYAPSPNGPDSQWPWADAVSPHPASMTIPSESETNITAVAQYIVQNESDPFLQVKAIHDYVIQRLTYDRAVLKTGKRPSQEARSVFVARQAVCEGYARLFQKIGQAAGFEVVYVSGKVRRDLAPVDVIPKFLRVSHPRYDWTNHAWNAVKVEDRWYLVDTTWDDGDAYDTSYLMLPPAAMLASHLPKFPVWQLLEHPITQHVFEQRPILTPQFFADHLKLLSPTTYQTRVDRTATIEIETSDRYTDALWAYSLQEPKDSNFFLWDWDQETSIKKQECRSEVGNGSKIHISCPLSASGDHKVILFKGAERIYLGQLNFQVS